MQISLDPHKHLRGSTEPAIALTDVGAGPILIRAGGASYTIRDVDGELHLHVSDARSLVVRPAAVNAIILTTMLFGA